jgi:hypothetical protein
MAAVALTLILLVPYMSFKKLEKYIFYYPFSPISKLTISFRYRARKKAEKELHQHAKALEAEHQKLWEGGLVKPPAYEEVVSPPVYARNGETAQRVGNSHTVKSPRHSSRGIHTQPAHMTQL